MTTEMVFKLISLTCYVVISFFQIRNFIKYRMTNGANYTRVCLFIINTLLGIHAFRLLFIDDHAFYFSSISVVWFAMQFQDWIYPIIAKIKNKIKL